jgi:hypothetical protein
MNNTLTIYSIKKRIKQIEKEQDREENKIGKNYFNREKSIFGNEWGLLKDKLGKLNRKAEQDFDKSSEVPNVPADNSINEKIEKLIKVFPNSKELIYEIFEISEGEK